MDEDHLVEAAGNVTRGVPIATPVFDGAKEADVNNALKRAGFGNVVYLEGHMSGWYRAGLPVVTGGN